MTDLQLLEQIIMVLTFRDVSKFASVNTAIEILPLEIRIDKHKWIVLNIYRPPVSNIQSFIDELSKIHDKSFSKYNSIIVMGHINITTKAKQAK